MSVAGQLVIVEGQAVIVAVRVVKIVEVVISGVEVSAGEELVGFTDATVVGAVDSENSGVPGVEAEDSMTLLEAGFTGPVIVVVECGVGVPAGEELAGFTEAAVVGAVDWENAGAPGVEAEGLMAPLEAVIGVVKVIGPTVLLGDTEESDEDPDPSELEWPDGETEEASGVLVATGEPDGVLVGTETLVEVNEPHLFSNEKLFTSTVAPNIVAPGQLIRMSMSASELTAVHCLVIVCQEPAVRVLTPTFAPLSTRSTVQEPAVRRKSKETE